MRGLFATVAGRLAGRRAASYATSTTPTDALHDGDLGVAPLGVRAAPCSKGGDGAPLASDATYFSDHHIEVPDTEDGVFSFRKLWAFAGPGFLISIAYLDPGNIEADLEAGALAQYKLLWALLWACTAGLLLQRLAARLGAVSGKHMAEHCYDHYPRVVRVLVWLMVELAIIGNDMQEVVGTAIAFYLLSNHVIKVWMGVLITILDTFTFLLIDKYGLRKLELLFAFFIGIMGVTFGYEYVVSAPPQEDVAFGLLPVCPGCGTAELLQIISLVGAIIAPHNLYLHSALVKTRVVDRSSRAKVREANKYYFIETTIAVTISIAINVFVVSVFGAGLHQKTNQDVREMCLANDNDYAHVFANNTELVEGSMYLGGIFLGCKFGAAAMYIWAVGLLAAGQSSTMTGCYSGQFVMEGFLHLRWTRWRRVLLTRTLAMVPTLAVAFYSRVEDLSIMNDTLNSIMSVQLPFALLPLIAFTGSAALMGEFVNTAFSTVLALMISAGIVSANTFYIIESLPDGPGWLALVGILGALYASLVVYLAVHMVFSIGLLPGLVNTEFVKRYIYWPPPPPPLLQHRDSDGSDLQAAAAAPRSWPPSPRPRRSGDSYL